MKNTDNILNRLFSHIKKTDTCWVWESGKDKDGYGFTSIKSRYKLAHRVVYELLVGEIPQGLQLDHLCRNRSCVNPNHLEPVTSRENTMRGNGPSSLNAKKNLCKSGHEFTEKNTYIARRPNDKVERQCRECRYLANQRYVDARKGNRYVHA